MAETIYKHEAGMTDEQYLDYQGFPRRAWRTGALWDTNPNELCEWERDEYRVQAEAIVRVLKELNLLPLLS